ncbi:MAG: hypothetical protein J5534_14615 [Fibrobacter sp.]|nr:hypothetical protein [Fibrobacter sp.]
METIQWTNLFGFLLTIAVAELVSRYITCVITRCKLKKWVGGGCKPLEPNSFNKGWVGDLRYYILLVSLVIYSFLGNHDILIVALTNIYLIVNTFFHLSKRWSKILAFINNLRIDGNGVHVCNKKKKMMNWDDLYLQSVRNWFDAKFKDVNIQIIKGIEICQRNRIEGCYYLDRIDQNFSRNEFINMVSQSFYSNGIFLLHLLAVIVINSVMLFGMIGSEGMGFMIGERLAENVEDVIYIILQIFSTVGFGDATSNSFLGICFSITMFVQTIATIVLGVAYKDFALNMVAICFDDMAKLLNAVINIHKRICIETILTKEIRFKSFEDVQKEQYFFSRTVFDKLKEFVEQKEYGE